MGDTRVSPMTLDKEAKMLSERPVLETRRPPTEETRYHYIARFTDGQTGEVEIVFVNNMFKECFYDFSGKYDLEHWKILGTISETIQILARQHLKIQEEKNTERKRKAGLTS